MGKSITPVKLSLKEILIKSFGVVLIFVCWEIISHILPPSRLPSPSAVIGELFGGLFSSTLISSQGGGSKGLFPHLIYTIQRWASGVMVGSFLGIVAGLVLGWSEKLRDFIEPPLETIRAIPPLVAVPFLLLWFGPGAFTQFLVVVFFCFMRVVVFTVEAINNVLLTQKQFALTLGASRGLVFKTVVLPAIFPELIGGIRVVMASSWGIEVVAELMGSQSGVGRVFAFLIPVLAAKSIIAAILWITIIAAMLDAIFVYFSRFLTKWVPENK